jgi:hypothetical protein
LIFEKKKKNLKISAFPTNTIIIVEASKVLGYCNYLTNGKKNSVMVQIKPKGSNQIDASIPNSIFKMFLPIFLILILIYF